MNTKKNQLGKAFEALRAETPTAQPASDATGQMEIHDALCRAREDLRLHAIAYHINPLHGNYFRCKVCNAEAKESDTSILHAVGCSFTAINVALRALPVPEQPKSESTKGVSGEAEWIKEAAKRLWNGSRDLDRALELQMLPAMVFANGTESECREWVLRNTKKPSDFSEDTDLLASEVNDVRTFLPTDTHSQSRAILERAIKYIRSTAALLALLEQYHKIIPCEESGKLIAQAKGWI